MPDVNYWGAYEMWLRSVTEGMLEAGRYICLTMLSANQVFAKNYSTTPDSDPCINYTSTMAYNVTKSFPALHRSAPSAR